MLEHPAVTAPIIGPRTMEQLESQLAAADVTLAADVLDRIDEIVPPGTNLNPADAGWTPAGARRRRRCGGEAPGDELRRGGRSYLVERTMSGFEPITNPQEAR